MTENHPGFNRLKDLEASQISHLFDGFCPDCLSLLNSRLLSLSNQNHVGDSGKADSSASSLSSSSSSSIWRTPSKEESGSYKLSPSPINGKPHLFSPDLSSSVTVSKSEEEEEVERFSKVGRKMNFVHYERVSGKEVNLVKGLELHTGVFSPDEQNKIVDSVYRFQAMGRKGQLMERTYSEPRKWMRGKGRVTIQFGCCYNYAVDKDGKPPGIIRDEQVDPLPPVFKQMIKRMVKWHVLPPTCVPNSCIVNIYDEGDCIPPHIDHHDFLRPFCTVSFLTQCNILFGLNLKVTGPGDFSGPISIPLPIGSVLVLKGNGADIAKHCVPAVPAKRISVTFRRMDESKIPYNFSPDSELLNLKPLRQNQQHHAAISKIDGKAAGGAGAVAHSRVAVSSSFVLENNEFPPLGGLRL